MAVLALSCGSRVSTINLKKAELEEMLGFHLALLKKLGTALLKTVDIAFVTISKPQVEAWTLMVNNSHFQGLRVRSWA